MRQQAPFAFGANWKMFLDRITPARIQNAQRSLTDFLQLENLCGKTFLDVGCGSGLFSLAAFKLGAERIVSFDPDPLSVECCRTLRARAGEPANWQVHQASILDGEFASWPGTFDIVYAWGTLQHTGRMWESLKRSSELVGPGGFLYIAVYNFVDGWLGSRFWLGVKRFYNLLPRAGQRAVEACAIAGYLLLRWLGSLGPRPDFARYESERGMHWRTDLTDWLGGLPYECATVEQVFKFVTAKCNGFELYNLKTTNTLSNNWYLFKKR